MNTYKEVQAIIYDVKNNKPYFLILHRKLRWKGWELLKGGIEEKENPRETIKREIFEETRLKNYKIQKTFNKRIIFFGKDKENVKKKAKYIIQKVFLVKTNMKNKIIINKNEVKEHDNYKWVDKETAIKMLTFDNAKKLIKNLKL
jgi:8-oxo-dGTP pyrophosphatase MutT (NUDIX family)